MMAGRLIILLLTVSQVAVAQSQNYTYITKYDLPKSPNASAFEKYLTIPGNYQTGQTNPAIPLMSLSLDGLDVPVSLTYSSTGLKLTDAAPWVGQGWNLSVGGTVTRMVKGLPDDSPTGLMFSYEANRLDNFISSQSGNTMTWMDKFNYFYDLYNQNADGEHDVFYYDALGAKGGFYINKLGSCVQVPKTNNIITFTKTPLGKLNTFTIITERGDKFLFTVKEESIVSSVETDNVTASSYYNELSGDTWYLSQIQTRNNQLINFTYNHYQYQKIEKSESQAFPVPGTTCFPGSSLSLSTTHIRTQVDIYQLSKISWKNGFINFNPGPNRTDLTTMDVNAAVPCLGSIDMYQSSAAFSEVNPRLLKNISFEYSQLPRLLLNKVNFNDNSRVPKYNYRFTYKGGVPGYPTAFSGDLLYNAQDYWGYYNGALNNPELIPFDLVSQAYGMIGLDQFQHRNNRVPDPVSASAGMLQEIYYPTGGKTKFYYEGNKAAKILLGGADLLVNTLPSSTNANGDILVTLGGVRTYLMEFYSDPASATPSTLTNIVYDPFQISVRTLPTFLSELQSYNIPDGYGGAAICDVCSSTSLYTVHSSSVNNPAPSLIEYGKVTEYTGASNSAGQTVHNYSYSQIGHGFGYDAPPYSSPQYLNYYAKEVQTSNQLPTGVSVVQKGTGDNTINREVPPAMPPVDQDLKISVFRTDNCINSISLTRSPTTEEEADEFFGAIFRYGVSTLVSENFVMTSSYETTYDPNNQVLTDQTNYNFNNTQKNLLLPNSTSKVTSKGDVVSTLLQYPQDYFTSVATTQDPSINGLVNLINTNVLSIPVEQINVINKNGNDFVTGGTLISFFPDRPSVSKIYRLSVSNPIPLSSFVRSYQNSGGNLVSDNRYQLEKQFYSFNASNQPLEFSELPSGVRHSLIWDYNSTYPIAETVGTPSGGQTLNLADIAYSSFEGDGSGGWNLTKSAIRSDASSPTGSKCYDLSSAQINENSLSSGRSYIVSYWIKNQSTALGLTNGSTNLSSNIVAKGPTVNGWTFFKHTISGTTAVQFVGNCLIDELRLYPAGAQMTTYTYDPLVGMTSQGDINNRITYYEYDGLQRLKYIRDQDHNILKSYDYQYQAPSGCGANCFIAPIQNPGGSNIRSYPVGVFNVNGKLLGNATNQAGYISLWNADTANSNRGTLAAGPDSLHFQVSLNTGKTLPPLTACRYYQVDLAWNKIDGIRWVNGVYVDFGDGATMATPKTQTDTPLVIAPNTVAYSYIGFRGAKTIYLIHTYADTSLKTLTFYHNDAVENEWLDNATNPATGLTRLKNLRGYLPQNSNTLGGSCYQQASMNSLANIANWNTINTITIFDINKGDLINAAMHLNYAQDFMKNNKGLQTIVTSRGFRGSSYLDTTFKLSRLKSDWNTYFTDLRYIVIQDDHWNREDLSALTHLDTLTILPSTQDHMDGASSPFITIPTSVIDNVINQVAAGAGRTVRNGFLQIESAGPSRSAASDAAVQTLHNMGWTVVVNGITQ